MDIHQIKQLAQEELAKELADEAKEKIKALMRKRQQAKTVLANIEREITDAYASIGEDAAKLSD